MAVAYETYGYYTVWWWEVFENVRKLTMMGMVVILSSSHTDRILIGVAVESFSLFLYGLVKPFRDDKDNTLAQACRAVTVAVLLYLPVCLCCTAVRIRVGRNSTM